MADGPRDRMVGSALKLLAQHGYQGASFSAILADSGAPRGSIYHHFPGGKDALVLAAIDQQWATTSHILETFSTGSAEEVVTQFVALWRGLLTATDYAIGCSLLGVAVSADVPDVLRHTGQVFEQWQARLGDLLVAAGTEPERAADLATVILASCEGAVVLCRAQRSLEPLARAEAALLQLVH